MMMMMIKYCVSVVAAAAAADDVDNNYHLKSFTVQVVKQCTIHVKQSKYSHNQKERK